MGKKWIPAVIGLLIAVMVLALAEGALNGTSDTDSGTKNNVTEASGGSSESGATSGSDKADARVKFADEETLDEEHLRDRDSLYEDQDDDGVTTMYLTVSSGNKADGTDHTWAEINQYSVYDYEKMGVSRYKVEGLLQVGDENGPVAGEFGSDQAAPNATVSIRGQTSSQNAQKNYKIRIKKNKGTLNGQRTIDLNKHMSEGLRFRNKLGFDMLRKIPQLMSLRTGFVHLYVRDLTQSDTDDGFSDYGLYTWVEQLNKAALKSHGLDRNGQLYKVNFFEFYRYPDVIKLSTDADYDQTKFEEYLEIKGNEDHTKLIDMLDDLNDLSIPIEQVIEEHFDMENLTYWMAYNILTGNVDTQSRNMFLYSPLNGNTWYLLSWDLDGCFDYDEQQITKGHQTYQSWQQGISNYWGNVLFRRCLTSVEFRRNLQSAVEDIRENDLTKETVQQMVSRYAADVKPYAFSMPDIGYEPLTSSEYDQIADGIPELMDFYYKSYLETLKKPMPFYIGTPEIGKEQLTISWDASYDLNGEKLTYTATVAKDPLMEDVVYTYTGADTSAAADVPAAGQYFLKVTVTNESGYTQDAFDHYDASDDTRLFGEICFYINEDGSVTRDTAEQ